MVCVIVMVIMKSKTVYVSTQPKQIPTSDDNVSKGRSSSAYRTLHKTSRMSLHTLVDYFYYDIIFIHL